jgi:hypothetical protein
MQAFEVSPVAHANLSERAMILFTYLITKLAEKRENLVFTFKSKFNKLPLRDLYHLVGVIRLRLTFQDRL